jgi:ubiquinone biosynthesis protein COQ9
MTDTRPPGEDAMDHAAEHATARASEDDHIARTRAAVVAAALPHVVFDGWTDRTLAAAVDDAGVDPGLARLAFPRGGVDLALAFHDGKDAELAADLASADLLGLRFRDRVAYAVMRRLELIAGDREAVRRAASLFALPNHAADGARAIWRTADTIWTALGDESHDFSWYSKRATLSAVYSSALLYWLGDDTPGASATREFVARRIDNVMQVEGVKAKLRANPVTAALLRGPQAILDRVRAPGDSARSEMPGHLRQRH